MQSITQTSLAAKTIKASLPVSDQPFIAITSHHTSIPTVAPEVPAEFVVTIRNTGTLPANSTTLTLHADSLVSYLSPPSFVIPILEAGQETTIRWEFVIREHVHSTGLYVVEAQPTGQKTLFSSGVYNVGVEQEVIDTSIIDSDGLPSDFALHNNYPNPFSTETTVRFDLPKSVNVKLTLYDTAGREIRTILDRTMPPGKHRLQLGSHQLPSGSYFLRFLAGAYQDTRSIVIVK